MSVQISYVDTEGNDCIKSRQAQDRSDPRFDYVEKIAAVSLLEEVSKGEDVYTFRALVLPIRRGSVPATFMSFVYPLTNAAAEKGRYILIPIAFVVDALFAPLRFVVGPFYLLYCIVRGEEKSAARERLEAYFDLSEEEKKRLPHRVDLQLQYSIELKDATLLGEEFSDLPTEPLLAQGAVIWKSVPIRPALTAATKETASINVLSAENTETVHAAKRVFPDFNQQVELIDNLVRQLHAKTRI